HAHLVADVGADEAVGGVDDAPGADRAAAPGRRAPGAVPLGAADHVVAVAQGNDAAVAHLIAGVGTDEAVGGVDDAHDAGGAAAPGRRPSGAVPLGAADHVVAVAQGNDAAVAHLIAGVGADE